MASFFARLRWLVPWRAVGLRGRWNVWNLFQTDSKFSFLGSIRSVTHTRVNRSTEPTPPPPTQPDTASAKPKKIPPPPPRKRKYGPGIDVFRTPDTDIEVVVGRSALTNERVSFELVAEDDLWFHVREHPGSHVILRCPRSRASAADIEFAAKLAARFSALKFGKINVSCYEGRQLSRPEGPHKPGLVMCSGRSTSITVRLPSGWEPPKPVE
eukprot:c13424_g1_i1.p1 GENE.c13424_g1_i1~~c13424_g1_i1.p1  ORF type:complete len:212 (+),score=23.08 c13424_g1_i1:61-696(+)